MIKRYLTLSFFIFAFALSIFPQCRDENCGLVIRGSVTDLQIEKTKDSVLFYVDLDVEFSNEGNEPIILFTNEFPDGYWLGGWSLYANKDDDRPFFGDGYWQSIIGSPAYRRMAEKLDVKSPPAELTKILQPKESWNFKGDFRIYFEAEKHTRFPQKKTWKEIQGFPAKLWVRFAYELNPWNVEYFKPNLIRKLEKRWKSYGNLLVETKKEGRFNHFLIDSEPMSIDFSLAKESTLIVKNNMNLAIELEREEDGRWIAEIDELDGVLVYGDTKEDAIKNVKTLALRVIADRLEN